MVFNKEYTVPNKILRFSFSGVLESRPGMSSWTSGADASTGSYGGCHLVYFGSYSTALATNRQSCESPAAIEPVCTLLAFGD